MTGPADAGAAGVALVTGAARRIGRTIAERLAGAGFAVALHHRTSGPEAAALAAAISADGGRAICVAADLADAQAVATIMPQVTAELGPVTLLVNCASIFEPDTLETLDKGLWDETMAINLRAPVLLARDMARLLPQDGNASIVNILDQRVLRPNPLFFSYTLAKSALQTATVTMAQALAPRIRVNGVAPGPTCRSYRQTDDDFARQNAATLLGHGPVAQEIADAVLYLARARSVTGQVLAVDGGQSLQWRTVDGADIPE